MLNLPTASTPVSGSDSNSVNTSYVSDLSNADSISLEISSLEFYFDVPRKLNTFIEISTEDDW
jgi:hypothetical protein